MPAARPSRRSTFFDLPCARCLFVAPVRSTFLFFSGILLIVFCYVLVPPYIVGLIANHLIHYAEANAAARPSLTPVYELVGLLAGSYAVVSLIRLSSKRMIGRMSINAR